MRILICNERFLFRYGVDRCLLMLSQCWRRAGHEVIMMGSRLDPAAVGKSSDRFLAVPEAPEYISGNAFTLGWLRDHWDEWFTPETAPDLALVAGWPFYACIGFLRDRCGCCVVQDYGGVPTDGMADGPRAVQRELRRLRLEHLPRASRIVAISRFLEETQSKPDAAGQVPTAVVHCGTDHILHNLWDRKDLDLEESDVLARIRAFKAAGERILFQPGRWEDGNYKNSAASVALSQRLTREGIPHRILVLADQAALPPEAQERFFGLGFVDDETMREAMALSDVGISPTLWEGFDLPLGEMQVLDRPMFVLNVGAHPEVVCDPYFLCADMAEMADKVTAFLREGLPFGEAAFRERCEAFRQRFTWQKSADGLMAEFRRALLDETLLLADVTYACHDTANNGVIRVTRKLTRFLQQRVNTVFVLWDSELGAYVLPTGEEAETLCAFTGPDPDRIRHRSPDSGPRVLLGDLLLSLPGRRRMLLWIETAQGDVMRQALPWLQTHRIAAAAVFHDAIPVLRPELCSPEVRENHGAYMEALADCRLVLPTAAHNGEDLARFWAARGLHPAAKIRTAALAAEMDGIPRVTEADAAPSADPVRVLFVSTLEPRKNHIRFLKAVERMLAAHPELAGRTLFRLVGKRYAGKEEIADFVERFCAAHPNVQWLGVVDDDALRREYSACDFTAYPSEIEGFGMPIIESLWAGKPCLCSNAGSIGELAAAGGCLAVDVTDEQAMADALYRLVSDPALRLRLRREAVSRPITTWNAYADDVAAALADCPVHFPGDWDPALPQPVIDGLRGCFEGWTGRRVIAVSNYYPPAFIGGAELIAHRQLQTLLADGLARGVAFSLDVSMTQPEGTVTLDTWEGVPVVRLALSPAVFDPEGIHFFHPVINSVFRALCDLVNPHIVHCHNMFGMSMGVIDVARAAGAKVFMTLHDVWGVCIRNTMLTDDGRVCGDLFACEACRKNLTLDGIRIPTGVRRGYLRRMFEKADALISPSRSHAAIYRRGGFDMHRLHVVWNGIDTQAFADCAPTPSPRVRVTFVGYFGRHKGLDVLVRALGRLNRPDLCVRLVGSGAEASALRALAASLGVADRLEFPGRVDNREIARVYRDTDIYCLPSVCPENQPVTITEAMACGIPVVASDLGGCPELVADGETGLLFPAGDDEALAACLARLADDPALRRRMGEAGRRRIAGADLHVQAARLADLYDSVPAAPAVSGKKVILMKGTVLPPRVDRVTACDVLLRDWILDPADLRQAVAAVLLPGERFTPTELQRARALGLTLLVPEEAQEALGDTSCPVEVYADRPALLRLLARF